jgi:hypothetical protein
MWSTQWLRRHPVTASVLALLITVSAGVVVWTVGGHGGASGGAPSIQGPRSQLVYLPARHTDFVFAVSDVWVATIAAVLILAVGLSVFLWRRARIRHVG